jgi:hypothetical protein
MHLPALKESRASKVDALRGIVAAAEKERRDMTEAEQAAFDTGKTELEAIEKQVRNAEFLAEFERRASGEPVTNGDGRFEVECREFSIRKAIASQIYGLQVDAGREREVSQELERRSGTKAEGIMCPTAVFEKRVVTTGLRPLDLVACSSPLTGGLSNLLTVCAKQWPCGASARACSTT